MASRRSVRFIAKSTWRSAIIPTDYSTKPASGMPEHHPHPQLLPIYWCSRYNSGGNRWLPVYFREGMMPTRNPPVTLPTTEQQTLGSSDDRGEYRLFISLPYL